MRDLSKELSALAKHCRDLREQGAAATAVAADWSRRICDFLDPTLVATGSLGRGEGMPGSDVDVLRIHPGDTPGLSSLYAAGILQDNHGVTAQNSFLPSTEKQWERKAPFWTDNPREEFGVVMTGLLADAASQRLRSAAFENTPDSPMVAEMLRDSINRRPPRISGIFPRRSFDLKSEALNPLIKIARWGALSSGADSHPLSTPHRLRSIQPRFLSEAQCEAMQRAFHTVFTLRLDISFNLMKESVLDRRGNVIVKNLPAETQKELIAAVATTRSIQKALAYLLSTSSFSHEK
ncbi:MULTISPECIES: putative nucleotidyltransferase substrate binding domain-containing protein [Corynebacterium]|uniref:putative nucleotidyltransferase substrate binding domain-containing protein n=1 Tax=Corynebacterium TaxID=1716 RepID=UPI00257E7C02|nr:MULTISPECIES: putative nucleotidyltransferase substrate binding domain-containing protein [Corynebacterium]